jgi:hypothetical protein
MVPSGWPWKRLIPSFCHSLPSPLPSQSPAWKLPIATDHFPSFLIFDWLIPSVFLFFRPYINPSTSQLHHNSPEDGDNMFLCNKGIYVWVYMVSKPKKKTSSSSSLPWKPQISQFWLKWIRVTWHSIQI